jgi:hypothetical protein
MNMRYLQHQFYYNLDYQSLTFSLLNTLKIERDFWTGLYR